MEEQEEQVPYQHIGLLATSTIMIGVPGHQEGTRANEER